MKFKLLIMTLLVLSVCCLPCAAQVPDRDPAPDARIAALIEDALHYGKGAKIFVSDYTHIQTITRRKADKKGNVKEESDTWEAYLPSQLPQKKAARWVRIKIRENGVSLAPDKIEKERVKAGEKLMAIEAESQKSVVQSGQGSADQASLPDARGAYFNLVLRRGLRGSLEFDVRTILEKCSFDAPRQEILNGRTTITLDFRPKPGMQLPEQENFVAQMSGTVWFDTADRILIKAEGWPMSLPLRHGKPAVFYEAVRVPGNKWLPRRIVVNGLDYTTFFNGFAEEVEAVLSEYKLFSSESRDDKITRMISRK